MSCKNDARRTAGHEVAGGVGSKLQAIGQAVRQRSPAMAPIILLTLSVAGNEETQGISANRRSHLSVNDARVKISHGVASWQAMCRFSITHYS
jgi:hypothetical protein